MWFEHDSHKSMPLLDWAPRNSPHLQTLDAVVLKDYRWFRRRSACLLALFGAHVVDLDLQEASDHPVEVQDQLPLTENLASVGKFPFRCKTEGTVLPQHELV